MPHPACSVCRHPQHEAIDAQLKAGESIRKTALRFGLTHGSLFRHMNHDKRTKTRINIGQIERIDEEIKKLIRAQNRAKKKRDASQVLAISRELRNWFTIRQKAELASIGSKQDMPESVQVPEHELIALAESLIESRLQDRDVRSWLVGVYERVKSDPFAQEEE